MKIDAQDIELFLLMLNRDEPCTIYDICKDLSDTSSRDELNKLHSKLVYRVSKWTNANLFSCVTENGVKRYKLNMDAILYFDEVFLLTDKKLLNKGKALVLELEKIVGSVFIAIFKRVKQFHYPKII